MYHNGQIVHDLSANKPIIVGNPNDGNQWAWDNIPKHTTCYMQVTGHIHAPEYIPAVGNGPRRYLCEIFLPASIEVAEQMLAEGTIAPMPKSTNRDGNIMLPEMQELRRVRDTLTRLLEAQK